MPNSGNKMWWHFKTLRDKKKKKNDRYDSKTEQRTFIPNIILFPQEFQKAKSSK